jgi:hypothetical protein
MLNNKLLFPLILLFFGIYFIGDFAPKTRLAETEWNLDLPSKQITKLKTIDLEDFYPEGKRVVFDIKPWLFQECDYLVLHLLQVYAYTSST